MCFSNDCDFYLHNIQNWYIALNHFHLNQCKGNGVVYLTMLAPTRVLGCKEQVFTTLPVVDLGKENPTIRAT